MGRLFYLHDVFLYLGADGLGVGRHGDGELDALALGEAREPVKEIQDLRLRAGIEHLVEVVYEDVGNVVVARSESADEAFHELKGADLVVAGVDEAGLIRYVVSEIFVLLNAYDVAVFLIDGGADELHKALGLAGTFQAHEYLDHI